MSCEGLPATGRRLAWGGYALLGITLLAGGLRFFNLGGFALQHDEFFTYKEALGRTELEVNWPLLFWLSRCLGAVLGHSEFSLRLPSAVFGTLCIPAFYYNGRRVFGEAAMLLAGLFIALNHWHLFHSQNARFYTAVFLFSGTAACLLATSLQTGKSMPAFLAALCVAVSAGFHPTGAWPALFYAVLCVGGLAVPAVRRRLSVKQAAVFFGPLLLAGGTFFLYRTQGTARYLAAVSSEGFSALHLLLNWARGIEVAVLGLGGCGLVLLLKRHLAVGLFALLLGVGPLATLVVLGRFTAVRADYAFAAAPV
jgi:dolichyl-phosphate-mannose--protein O-mannosyl transferase